MQDVDGRLAGVRVLAELLPRRQRDERLAQGVLVAAIDGVGAAAAGGGCYPKSRGFAEALSVSLITELPVTVSMQPIIVSRRVLMNAA